MASIFTRIILGEIPCYRVAESDQFFAFLDINPIVKGHTLVVPKREVDVYFQLEDAEIAALSLYCKLVSQAIEKVIPCNRVGMVVMGLEVPHAHVHLMPINSMADMDFTRPKHALSKEEMESTAALINTAFHSL